VYAGQVFRISLIGKMPRYTEKTPAHADPGPASPRDPAYFNHIRKSPIILPQSLIFTSPKYRKKETGLPDSCNREVMGSSGRAWREVMREAPVSVGGLLFGHAQR
jgi:hypothetical protein